jgi:hypothetical protein
MISISGSKIEIKTDGDSWGEPVSHLFQKDMG